MHFLIEIIIALVVGVSLSLAQNKLGQMLILQQFKNKTVAIVGGILYGMITMFFAFLLLRIGLVGIEYLFNWTGLSDFSDADSNAGALMQLLTVTFVSGAALALELWVSMLRFIDFKIGN